MPLSRAAAIVDNGAMGLRSLAIIPFLAALACGTTAAPTSNPPAVDPPAPAIDADVEPVESAAPASYSCTSDDECKVSCKREDDCCGKLCECDIPYHRDQLERIIEDHRANCKRPCAVARCVKPEQRTIAKCVEGSCTAVKAPWPPEDD